MIASTDKSPKNTLLPVHVLIVEDEVLIGWSLASKLKQAGFMVTITDTGEDAIEKFSTSHFDIVLTDLKLPRIDGIAVASKIKSLKPGTPIILISADEDYSQHQQQIGSVIDRFVEKPFDLAEIVSAVEIFTAGKTN